VQKPKRGPGRPRQEGSIAAAEATKKDQRKDMDEASKRALATRAALAKKGSPPRLTCSRPYRSEIVMEHILGYSIMASRQIPALESTIMLVNI
jgi:hypothetical protein